MTAVIFKKVDYGLSKLVEDIDFGDIGLPDIQRPFIWKNVKVRDLFDSMYKGFPVGYFLFWANDRFDDAARQIGVDLKQRVPKLLVIDGQQRLTSLYSVIMNRKVIDKNYGEVKLNIAFNPISEKFEVTDAAIRRDPEWIPDISAVWGSEGMFAFVTGYLAKLRDGREMDADEEKRLAANIDKLHDLVNYPFTALEVSGSVGEEEVADIFVRINSEGVMLNQADFILTLMSVFWEEGRVALEKFCRASRQPSVSGPSPHNHFINPDPDQLLRVGIALAFRRARLSATYNVLRGKDLETGEFSPELRDHQFGRLEEAQSRVLNLNNWHAFFRALTAVGHRGWELVSSQIALLYSYAFYLIGATQFNVPDFELERLIGRFFFMASLTRRYTGSIEAVMEEDLARLRGLRTATEFTGALNRIIDDSLTGDFWSITLPNALESSYVLAPALKAYHAAQIKLQAPVLFSQKKVADLFDPMLREQRKPLDRHHLFPRGYLERTGVTDLRHINQIANLAYAEFVDNIDISDQPPREYVPERRRRFDTAEYRRMLALNALPEDWELMAYDEFLDARRPLIAQVIRRGFEATE